MHFPKPFKVKMLIVNELLKVDLIRKSQSSIKQKTE